MNLIANGGFEINAFGWVGSNATVVRDTGEAKDGAASGKVTSTGMSNASVVYANVETGNPLPMKIWTFRGHIKAEGAAIGRSAIIRSVIYHGAQVAAVLATVTLTLTADWQPFAIMGATDELDRRDFDFFVTLVSPAGAGEVFYLDAIDIEELPSPARRIL